MHKSSWSHRWSEGGKDTRHPQFFIALIFKFWSHAHNMFAPSARLTGFWVLLKSDGMPGLDWLTGSISIYSPDTPIFSMSVGVWVGVCVCMCTHHIWERVAPSTNQLSLSHPGSPSTIRSHALALTQASRFYAFISCSCFFWGSSSNVGFCTNVRVLEL